MMWGYRQILLAGSLLWLGVVAGAQDVLNLDALLKPIPVNIKPQPLREALTDWARQTGIQLIVPVGDETNRISPRVKGELAAQEALDQLLAGSGMRSEWINERTVAISERYPPSGRIAERKPATKARLVSFQPEEEVMVTGSRLRGDIRVDGSVETHAPVTVIDREELDGTGVSTVPQLLRFVTQQPYGPIAESASENSAQFVEIRGLGFDSTLVLINGRRTIPSATSVSWNAFDVSTLPLAAIERVEVLSDSASAVYGTDAVGGVVNFILKKEIPHPVLDLNYGTASGGAEERHVTFSDGYSNERFRGSLVLDYFDRGTLLGAERDRLNDQDFRRFGGRDYRAFTTNPGNITSLTSANLPGLPSGFAAVPAGSTGIGLTPADFLATAGQRNSDSLYRFRSIVPAALRRSVTASADFDLSPAVNVFGELIYMDDRNARQVAPAARTLTVPANNPFNPFGVAVSVEYLFRGLTPTFHVESERYRAVAGLRGALRDWDWELSLLSISDEGSSWGDNGVDTAKANAALAAIDPEEALNVFSDGPGGSPALLASLVAQPSINVYSSEGTQWAGVLRGPLFALPAGDADMVLGSEWLQSDMLYDSSIFVASSRSVAAGFTELRLPMVSPEMQVAAIRKLTLTLAARYDHYSDVGDTVNPQYGLVWVPAADLTLRASYGTSFRAPSLFELNSWRFTNSGSRIPDPLRNNELTQVTLVAGGNTDLDPVEANSLTAGFDFTPSAIQGLQLSASYWRIEMDKRVGVPNALALAKVWEQFPDRVVRAERAPADIAAGLPGRLIYMDLTRMNSGALQTSGIDLTAAHEFETRIGIFNPSLSATWIDKYSTQDLPGMPATDRLGVINPSGTIARWKAVASLGWDRHGISLSVTARYTAAYADADALGITTDRVVPSQTLIDLQGSLDFSQRPAEHSAWLAGLILTGGISNLFDSEPPFAERFSIWGYDLTQGDLRQRFGYLKLSARF